MKIAPTEVEAETVLCSKCGKNPRAAADSTNPWCKDCLAKYQREYKEMLARRTSEQAYARGASALRTLLIVEFERLGSGSFSGYEIAELIRRATAPVQGEARL